jgi:DmsE family decaheme c-type cytochrome
VNTQFSSWFTFDLAGPYRGTQAKADASHGKLIRVFVLIPDLFPAVRQLSIVASGLIYLALLAFAQPACADPEQSKLANPDTTNNPHPHLGDTADLVTLREYAQQIGVAQIKLASIEESKHLDPHFDSPELLALREYAQQIGAEQPKLASIEGSKHGDPHLENPELLALREYAQQIGAAQPDSASAPPLKTAEADTALDALRDFFGGGAPPNPPPNAAPAPTPNSTPKATPRTAPRGAKPAAPKHAPPVFYANFVGTRTCLTCHASQAEAFSKTLMGKLARTQPGKLECENCHGPGSEHLKAVGCAACHGEGGVTSRPGTPSLVGQDPQYLVPAMKAYVTGQRKHELMRAVLVGVGEAELHNIASYYARQFPARAQTPLIGDPSAGKGATAVCAGCHGERGVSIVPAWPSLAGQDAQYLADAIRAYKHGSRTKAIACAACHGAGGISRTPGMPNLAGMDPEYLVPAMRAYVTGERRHALMNALLSGVSESELDNMAAFYAGQTPARAQTPLVGDPSSGKAAGAVCVGCHGQGGGSANPAWPSLAGQDAQYLATAIRAYKEGSRDKPVACAACHGERGISKISGTPSLVGMDQQYLVAAMKAYVSGERKHAVMKALLAHVSDAELNNMALYYARQVPARAQTPSVGDASAGKTASASCAGCHGEQGVSSNPAWPSLAGQDARYLANALKAYKDGSRTDATMKALVASLDERTINDIAAYYASLRPTQPASAGDAPVKGDPILVSNGIMASLDGRTIDDVASYFASLQPSETHGAHNASGRRDPVLVRNALVASLDDRTTNNVASYYATLRPDEPPGARRAPAGPVPARIGPALPLDKSGLGGIVSFRADDPSRSVDQINGICLGCHERGARTNWSGSTHEVRGVACTNCHVVMRNVTPKFQLAKLTEMDTCFQCHKDKRAQMWRSSHMPVREGKVTCSSCHNPHGSYGDALLKEATVNDNCYKCHAEKRGPFLYEHPPVRENCLNCHEPHGSNNDFLLKVSRPRLCQQCHANLTGHPGNPRNPTSLYAINRECQNCHSQHHGSNTPGAGARWHR